MKLYTKDVEPLGFKGSGMFDDSRWHHFYHAELPKSRQVYIIDSLDQSLSHFDLNKQEWKLFQDNKLALVPLGCCSVSGNKYKDNPIVDFKGDFKAFFKTRKRTLEFIEKKTKQNS